MNINACYFFCRARHFRTIQRPAELEAKSKKCNQKHDTSESDTLSQDSNTARVNDQLMFGCLLDKDDDDDDLDIKFDQTHQEDICSIFNCCGSDFSHKCFDFDDSSLNSSLLSSDDIDVFNSETLTCDTSNDFGQYDDQAILTPAYFDPGTGMVTLLLPSMNPEY